jgi:diguanylate cyclase (GGDEF)-like protein
MNLSLIGKHLLLMLSWLALWRLAVFMEYAPHASIWFPPAGLTFAAFLLGGWRVVGTISLACILSTIWEHYIYNDSRTIAHLLISGALFALIHSVIYGMSAQLLRGAIKRVNSYNLYHVVMRFMTVAATASLLMALGGVLVLYDGLSLASFGKSVLGWWIGDMSGILVLSPLFVAFMNRLYPKRGLLTALQYRSPLQDKRWSYGLKLSFSSLLLIAVVTLAHLFNSSEIACFVFFLALPQMWIVYTETPYHSILSLALYSVTTAALVTLYGVSAQAFIYQVALSVVACCVYFVMGVPALLSANQELNQKNQTDPLTGTFTRDYFFTLADHQMKQAKRYRQTISLILIDVDEFKAVNDSFGHSAGDVVLQNTALEIKESLRESDILGRFGGDEFMVMLPQTNEDDAVAVAEQIRQRVERLTFSQPTLAITCSFGVTELDPKKPFQHAFELADSSLFSAKRAGRNQTLRGR